MGVGPSVGDSVTVANSVEGGIWVGATVGAEVVSDGFESETELLSDTTLFIESVPFAREAQALISINTIIPTDTIMVRRGLAIKYSPVLNLGKGEEKY